MKNENIVEKLHTESNPLADKFSWITNTDWVLRVMNHCSQIPSIYIEEEQDG